VQSVKGQPNGAQIGEFVQQNADYLKGLKEVADGVMRDHRKNVYEGASVHFTPDHDKRWRDAHPEDFEPDAPAHEEQPPPPAAAQGGPGMAVGAPATPPVDALEAEMKRRGLKPKSAGASGGF
jgi:hypothetical protein